MAKPMKTILVMTREIDLAGFICKGLESRGYKAQPLLNPDDAADLIRSRRPHLMLLDLVLPGKRAHEFLQELKEKDCLLPFIIMFNRGDETPAGDILEWSPRDYLVKETGFLEFLPFAVEKVFQQMDIEKQLAEARESIAQNEAELKLVTENMLELVARLDEEGTYQYVSPSHKALLGYEPNQMLGNSAFDFICPEDLQQAVKAFQKGLTAPPPEGRELRFRHAGGHYLWLDVKVNLTHDEEDKINGTIWISRDVTKRKEIAERLERCRETYRALVNRLPVGFCRTTPGSDGRFLMVNQVLVEMLGYGSQEELKKVWVRDLYLDPNDRKRFSDQVLEQGSLSGSHLQLIKKDGSFLWCIDHTRAVDPGDGSPVQLESILEDVTELKMAEQEINSQKHYFSALFKNSTDAIAYINLEHQLEDMNLQFTKIFGYTLEELKGRNLDRVLAPGHKYQEARHLTEMVLTGASVNMESTRFSKGGKPVDVSIKGVPVLVDGDIVGCYTIFANITERKRVEDAVQRSEERHREIIAAIEEGYYEMDLVGNIVFCNDAASRLMGYARDELLGMDFPRLFKEPGAVYRAFHRIYMSGKPQRGFTLEVVAESGHSRFEEYSLSLIKDKYGKVQGFRGVGRDITERKKYEEKLKLLSLYDQMTGLYNRAYIEDELRRLEGGRVYPITIIIADLDGLKLINDTMGHRQGDEMLKICARVLKKPLRSSDVLARVGGDEFAAILPRTDEKTGEKIIQRIHEALESTNRETPQLPLSLSLGAATANDSEESLEDVFIRADNCMYRDKLHQSSISRTRIVDTLLQVLLERDHISEGHADRLEALSRKIAKRIGLSSHQIKDLALLARVHDLGKVGIPERILFKEGKLTTDDWEIIKQHPEKGYRIATSSPDLAVVADLILRHHEWWDGTGYPLGLKGEEIPVECRILSIIDAYDNMTHGFYSRAMSREEAIQELRSNAGTQFDPQLTELITGLLQDEAD